MNIFTQLVTVIGKVSPNGIKMLGTGFLVASDGKYVTTRHVSGEDDSNLVVLLPNITDINEYQDLSDSRCQMMDARLEQIDPTRDLSILKVDAKISGSLLKLGTFDDDSIGDEVAILGFPHCVDGRRALTYQKAEIGAKVMLEENGIQSKHAVINIYARPGQSGSMIFNLKKQSISGILIGAWIPSNDGGISLAGINPRELHQTTHCISAEYVRDML